MQLNVNTTGQYLDGNVISNNTIGTNNLLKSASAGNGSTVGVSTFVAAGSTPLTVTVTREQDQREHVRHLRGRRHHA